MYPRSFEYFSPTNLDEVLTLIGNGDSAVKVLAGGQSLIPALKSRTFSVKSLIDITRIKELEYLRKEGTSLKIGALTTTGALEYDRVVASSLTLLREVSSQIADPLVRNLGTVGGNLCYADPANDLPATMIALRASFVLAGKEGLRSVNADAFFSGPSKTVLKPNELLTEVEVPLGTGKVGGAYRKVKKGSGGFTIAGVAINLSVADDESISACRIALTAVGPRVLRAEKAEQILVGRTPETSVFQEAAQLAVEASHPASDINASAEYRRKTLRKLVEDTAELAYKRAEMS